ncbi:MAG TPA: hypothetical protein VFU19_00165 [Iamia sp.]|nr:hypothetical protein [Iamia sp.]
MDLVPYVARIQRDLITAAETGDDTGRTVAERMAAATEPALRLALLDALVEASGEISETLGPGAVEVRLRGHEVGFAVTPPDITAPPAAPTGGPADEPEDDDGSVARLSLRMPERLKQRVETAADTAGLSVNAWLVRSISALVDTPTAPRPPTRSITGGQRHTGWAR